MGRHCSVAQLGEEISRLGGERGGSVGSRAGAASDVDRGDLSGAGGCGLRRDRAAGHERSGEKLRARLVGF